MLLSRPKKKRYEKDSDDMCCGDGADGLQCEQERI